MAILGVLLVLFFTAKVSYALDPDPCVNPTIISDLKRSTEYVMDDTEKGVCDMNTPAGWYRFNSTAGTMMPETCVKRYHCGTTVPIWMRGHHPSVSDGIVQREGCANFGRDSSCCSRHLTLDVKNCGGFFVYHLFPTPACPIAYCAGQGQTCPFGQWSSNGLEPGCKDLFPKLSARPLLEGPVKDTPHSFVFRCRFDYPNADTDQSIEIWWTAEGEKFWNETVDYPIHTSTLNGSLLHGHLNKAIGCKIRGLFRTGPDVRGPWFYSDVYQAEIKVEPTHVIISEDGTSQNITLTSTIPIVCTDNKTASCVVSILLDFNGPKDNAQLTTPCNYELYAADWNDTSKTVSTNITLFATSDKLDDGTKQMILSFRDIFTFGNPYIEVFDGHKIQPIHVDIHDSKTHMCTMDTDPHIWGFKKNHFHLFDVGIYTMYHYKGQNTEDEFELQIHTFPCNNGVSCICGVAIRENNDVIQSDFCNDLRATPIVTVPRPPLSMGIDVDRATDGTSMVVYFPSGREVKIVTGSASWGSETPYNYNDVTLVVPGSDMKGTSRGICGTLDPTISSDVYIHKNGAHERPCAGVSNCVPAVFEESWRVNASDSWFEKVPPVSKNAPEYRFCQCYSMADNYTAKRLNCSSAADTFVRITHCDGTCKAQDRILGLTANNPTINLSKRSVLYDDEDEPNPPINPQPHVIKNWNVNWPTEKNKTEQEARNRCLHEMQKSQLWELCGQSTSMTIVNTTLENCMSDILFTDSYALAESALSSFTSQCQSKLSLDPQNYEPEPNGESVITSVTTEVCSAVCLRNGNCTKGHCQCHPGFVGDNCQLDATKGPQLLRLRGKRYCDVNERPCRKMYFDAKNFQMGDDFLCKSQEILENDQLSHENHTEGAIFINSVRLACVIPDAKIKTEKWIKTYNVSATFDGQMYGNAMTLSVYDSFCYACDEDTGCTRKPNTCLINNLCYRDGDSKPDDATRLCMPSHTEDSWTRVSLCTGEVLSDEWTVFQRRLNDKQDFYLGWDQYVTGFGRNDSNYWMGLEPLHQLTSSGSYELHVDLKDWNDVTASASYSNFSISGADDYTLLYDQFIGGNAGDSLSKHRHMPFSTKDADHDLAFTGSCADWYHGGWWYNACQDANLNGRYITTGVDNATEGIQWNSFRGQGHSLQCTEMRVRPTPSGTIGNLVG